MKIEGIEIMGIVAAILITAAFVPQVYRVWRLQSTNDISLTMYSMLLIGILLWVVYGIHHKSVPIILANSVTSILILCLTGLKLKYK